MARGFESKDVEFQQEEAGRRRQPPRRPSTPAERERDEKHRTLELALTHARADRASATNETYRQMLDTAISDLEARLRTDG
jgi:hypothetical protein